MTCALLVTARNFSQRTQTVAPCAVALILCVLVLQTVNANEVIRFGTGGNEGSYFPVGSIIAVAINERRIKTEDGREIVVLPQRSNGSVANLNDISDNLLEMGLAQADVVSFAHAAVGQFEDTAVGESLRTVGTLYVESVHLVVTVDSGIEEFSDLAGKRVSVDELGSGTQIDVEPMLAAHEMTYEDIQAVYLKPVDSIERLREGQLDAFFMIAGYPIKGVKDLVDEGIGKVIGLEQEIIDQLTSEHLYFSRSVIPANIYANDSQTPTLGVPAQIIVNNELDESIAYEITKTLWSESTLKALAEGHPRGADIAAETALRGVAIPLHLGSFRYYQEQGISVPQHVR